jgi:hypothetical protein
VHVDFAADGKSLEPSSAEKLKQAWGDAGVPQDSALVFHASGPD